MAIYTLELDTNTLSNVQKTSFSREAVKETNHLQQAIKKNIKSIAPDCFVISEEYSEWSESRREIDLLAIDKDANLVVIELKRTETGDHMELQSLRYASMVSTMTFDHAISVFTKYMRKEGNANFNEEEAIAEIRNFLEVDSEEEVIFGEDVKIILVSQNFSKELTTSVIWLNERDLNIKCVRVQPYNLNEVLLLDVQQIIPLPEAIDYQVKAQKKAEERREKNSKRDNTKYLFNNTIYNKRKLVLAIINFHISKSNISSFSELLSEFSQDLRAGTLFKKFEEVIDTKQARNYFLEENERLNFSDGVYVINNQWGKDNIGLILQRANELGLQIEKQ